VQKIGRIAELTELDIEEIKKLKKEVLNWG